MPYGRNVIKKHGLDAGTMAHQGESPEVTMGAFRLRPMSPSWPTSGQAIGPAGSGGPARPREDPPVGGAAGGPPSRGSRGPRSRVGRTCPARPRVRGRAAARFGSAPGHSGAGRRRCVQAARLHRAAPDAATSGANQKHSLPEAIHNPLLLAECLHRVSLPPTPAHKASPPPRRPVPPLRQVATNAGGHQWLVGGRRAKGRA